MPDLRVLDASHNGMTGIPAEIGQLSKLETANFSFNRIDALPHELYQLKDLRLLDLRRNPLSTAALDTLRRALPNTVVLSD
jgi:Leucine-rich repeat (LRR) protein